MGRMSLSDLREWMAFFRLEPPGEQRLELMLAQLTAMTFNRYKKEDAPLKTPQDFLPDYGSTAEERRLRDAEHMKAKMAAVRLQRLVREG